MKYKYTLLTALSVLFLMVLGIDGLRADTLILKNGNEIEGIVTREGKDYIVEFPSGTMKVPIEEVQRVRKSVSKLQKFRTRHKQIEGQDAQSHYELGRWARTVGLTQQAKQEFNHAIQRNPDHEGARKALGFTQYNGQWMTREEKMRKKGYVQYQGEWMTPDVKQARLEVNERQKEQQQKINRLQQELEASRQKITQLQDEVRNLRNSLRASQVREPIYRYYPIFTQSRKRRRHHRKRDPHQKLWTRKDNGNTVIVQKTKDGQVWKEITGSGQTKVIHEPGDGHTAKISGDHSKLHLQHQQNNTSDIELLHPKHHDPHHHDN